MKTCTYRIVLGNVHIARQPAYTEQTMEVLFNILSIPLIYYFLTSCRVTRFEIEGPSIRSLGSFMRESQLYWFQPLETMWSTHHQWTQ